MKKQTVKTSKRKAVISPVERKRIAEILASTPDVRKNKIEAIKKAIAEGSYQVEAAEIARKMLKELVTEVKR